MWMYKVVTVIWLTANPSLTATVETTVIPIQEVCAAYANKLNLPLLLPQTYSAQSRCEPVWVRQ